MLHSIAARKLVCFIPAGLGLSLLLTLWLSLPHPAESSGVTVCPTGCDYTTIQSAVLNVAEGSTILVAAGVYTESILITQSLTLEGAGAMSTTITAATRPQYTSVITISEGITVTLKGFQISGGTGSLVGDTAYGGGIYNLGVTNLVDSTIIGNNIESAFAKGGGIYNQGSMSLENVLLQWNSAFNVYAYGGAIYNEGDLILNQLSIIENFALTQYGLYEAGPAFGGGIYNGCAQDRCGALTIASTVLYGNDATGASGQYDYPYPVNIDGRPGLGGAIYNGCGAAGCASIVMSNTLITGNRAKGGYGIVQEIHNPYYGFGANGSGGGIYHEGGVMTLFYSMVADNEAARGEAMAPGFEGIGQGGGIFTAGGTIFLKGTLIGGNDAYNDGPDCWGTLTSQGYNLLQNTTNCTMTGDPAGNLLGLDPLLFPFDDYGDPTPTQPIAFNSPAVDAGDPLDCPPTDQRGVPRPVDGNQDGAPRCDIGAYERLPPTEFLYLPLLYRP